MQSEEGKSTEQFREQNDQEAWLWIELQMNHRLSFHNHGEDPY